MRSNANDSLAGSVRDSTTHGARPIALLLLLCFVAAADFYALRCCRRPGGDMDFAESIAEQPFTVFYVRSPLTVYLHQAVYHFVFQPMGWPAREAVAVCSALAGGLFVVALLLLCDRGLFLLFNLAAPFLMIFFGHIEHYAWVNMLLAFFFVAAKRQIETNGPLTPALALLLLAAAFHMLAVFYVPAFLFLVCRRNPQTRRWEWATPQRDRENCLLLLIFWILWYCGSQLSLHVGGLDNNLTRIVPLRLADGPTRYFFPMFSWTHLKMWLYFHWLSSPLGLLLLILLARRIRSRFEWFLLTAVGCGFLWTWVWHPDRGRGDWDLFANLALPMNILVGLLLAGGREGIRSNESFARTT